MKEFIDGGYDPTELNEKKEEYKREAKRMHLREGRIYSYRRSDGIRAFFRYDGIKEIEPFLFVTPVIRFRWFSYSADSQESFTDSSLKLETLKVIHSQQGMRRANRKEIRKFRREWAKSMLQTS